MFPPHVRSAVAAVLVWLAALLLELKFGRALPGAGEALLTALIALSFFLRAEELALGVGGGILFLNWEPTVSPEMLLFTALPFIAFGARRFFPGSAWAGNACFAAGGVFLFYLLSNLALSLRDITSLIGEALASAALGLVFFAFLRACGESRP